PGPVGMQFKIEADLLLYNANQAITFTPVSPFSGASGGINNNNPTVLLTWTNAYVPANNKIAYFTLTAGPVSGKYKVNLKDITIAYGYPIQTVNYPSAQGVIVEVR
ncbi:MAG: hypothetical protein Q8R37_01835, partial [Nanoarchaeota archaeon]|nr:hypothetical protein [Nanoarchaeota archaeon]